MDLDTVARILVLEAIANSVFTAVLIWAASRHPWASLRERATAAAMFWLISFLGGLLGMVHLGLLHLGNDAFVVIMAVAFMGATIPNAIWFVAFLVGWFDGRTEQ